MANREETDAAEGQITGAFAEGKYKHLQKAMGEVNLASWKEVNESLYGEVDALMKKTKDGDAKKELSSVVSVMDHMLAHHNAGLAHQNKTESSEELKAFLNKIGSFVTLELKELKPNVSFSDHVAKETKENDSGNHSNESWYDDLQTQNEPER